MRYSKFVVLHYTVSINTGQSVIDILVMCSYSTEMASKLV